MLPRSNMSTPIGFKLWFGLVGTIVVCVWIGVGYVAYSAIKAGPEGIGRAIGEVIKGVKDAQ